MTLLYKLPAPFVEKHKALLESIDWRSQDKLELHNVLPVPELARVTLETVSRGKDLVIRSANGRSMVAVRNYSDALAKGDETKPG